MTPRENAMAILRGEKPDAYIDIMTSIQLVPDPVTMSNIIPQDGLEHKDSWGTVYVFKPGAPGAHPHVTEENAVIKDIEKWRETVVVPSLEGLDFTKAKEVADSVDRKQKFVGFLCAGGLFERSHHLMGMQEALMAYMTNPEDMADLLRVIADYKIASIKLCAKEFQPDIIFYHDDWGSKQNVFLPPSTWREIIKPLQKEIADTIHECGMIYMHHADCICEPYVEDMVEIGVDVWQGVIAQNDIPEIQRITGGKLAMAGGIDGPKVDLATTTEEELRTEVRRAIDTYCTGGRFFPGIPNGRCYRPWNDSIVKDELVKYGIEFAQKQK